MPDELLEEFRLSMEGAPPKQEERQRLIEEGKELAGKLTTYGARPPRAPYLTASMIEITKGGLRADRSNIALNRVPISKIEEAIEDGKKRLSELEEKVDVIMREFSTDVAEICFANVEMTGNKGLIMKELDKRRRDELQHLCDIMIPQREDVDLSLSIDSISCRIRTRYYLTRRLDIYAESDGLEFLTKYNETKTKLTEVLEFYFGKREVTK